MGRRNDRAFQRLYDRLYDDAWKRSSTADSVQRHFEADYYARAKGSPYASQEQLAFYETEAVLRWGGRIEPDPMAQLRRVAEEQWRICFDGDFAPTRISALRLTNNRLLAAAWTFTWCSTWARLSASLLSVPPAAALLPSLIQESLVKTGDSFNVPPSNIFEWLSANGPRVTTEDCTEQLLRWRSEATSNAQEG